MTRKQRRSTYPVRRGSARPEEGARQAQIDVAARALTARHTLEELRSLLGERMAVFEQARQGSTADSLVVDLAPYRAARTDLEVARRAVALARLDPGAPATDEQ